MAGSTGPDIIQDGLVLALDAANTKSYPGSGTTIYNTIDLNQSGTLTNGVLYNSTNIPYLQGDGTDAYIEIDSVKDSINETGKVTISAWVYINSSDEGCYVASMGSNSTNEYRYFKVGNIGSYVGESMGFIAGLEMRMYYTGGEELLVGSWNYVTATLSGNNNMYVNGVVVPPEQIDFDRGTSTTTFTISTGGFNIFRRRYQPSVDTHYDNGQLAILHVHNRHLTPKEILQNYNQTKSRFL